MMAKPQAKVVLHLRIRTAEGKRTEFLKFLQAAIPYYEQPGGIRVRLLQDSNDPDAFIEIVEYETWAKYREDNERVESDPVMRGYLERWRALLKDSAIVELYTETELPVSEEIASKPV